MKISGIIYKTYHTQLFMLAIYFACIEFNNFSILCTCTFLNLGENLHN